MLLSKIIHPNLKINILLKLEDDNNIVLKLGTDANNPVSKVIITKLRLWAPKIIFNEEGLKAYLAEYFKTKNVDLPQRTPRNKTKWSQK